MGDERVEVVFVGDGAYFVLRGRFKVYPRESPVRVLGNHRVSIKRIGL